MRSVKLWFIVMPALLCLVCTVSAEPVHSTTGANEGTRTASLLANLIPDTGDNNPESSRFGTTISISGNRVAVGAPGQLTDQDQGTVYVFTFDGTHWVQSAAISPDDYMADDFFGGAVSLDGDVLAVGAPYVDGTDENTGAVYIYVFDGLQWNLEQKIFADVQRLREAFGVSLDLQGDRLLVGMGSLSDEGAAYVYERSNQQWTLDQTLTASDGFAGNLFGFSVSLDGDRALIGAYWHDRHEGAAYVFDFDGQQWQETAQLLSGLTNPAHSHFGYSVALSGDEALVGATQYDGVVGAVFAFEYQDETWQPTQTLDRLGGTDFDIYGFDLAFENNLALVGTPRYSVDLVEFGAAYVFKKSYNKWHQIARITDAPRDEDDRFGQAVALSGDLMAIGALSASDSGPGSGAAKMYSLNPDLIFANDLDQYVANCDNQLYPPGLNKVSGVYRHYNEGGFDFGESTNAAFHAPMNTSDYWIMADFSFPSPNTRRMINMMQPLMGENPMAEATISISECPGDFTPTAACLFQVTDSSDLFLSTSPADASHPTRDYCILNPDKIYYFNLVLSPEPLTQTPECLDSADTQCSLRFHELSVQ